MSQAAVPPLFRDTRSDWVRLRTLTLSRWLAIAGQVAAILVASAALGLRLPVALCLMVVGLSVLVNLASGHLFPRSQRLTEVQALVLLGYDLIQLGALLALTGGLANPFALLILAPVAIAAAILELRSTLIIGALGVAIVSLLLPFSLPLRLADGSLFTVPPLYRTGFWFAVVVGILFLGGYSRRVAAEMRAMSDAVMAAQMALAREQKLTDLGGVVAAAAHELGTPLATIKLVSSELIDELAERPDLAEDAVLIRDQADRCRDILRAMGRQGKDDRHLRQAPLLAVLREAAEPHLARGKTVAIEALHPLEVDRQPTIQRRPEIIHGLRNLVQNAVDFAAARVWITADWSEDEIILRVVDDGPGFPPQMIDRIGDPFLRKRPATSPGAGDASGVARPGYDGMGLGLFIAKTLLERTGARIDFANAADPFLTPHEWPLRSGASVEIRWPRAGIEADPRAPQGENPPLQG